MDDIQKLFCLLQHDPAHVCSKVCGECRDHAAVAQAYVARREAAAAEAMRAERIMPPDNGTTAGSLSSYEAGFNDGLDTAIRLLALPIPDAATEPQALRVPEGPPSNELRLLLTVARILRSRLQEMSHAWREEDRAALDEALAPWSPLKGEPINLAAPAPPSDGGKE